MGGFTIKPEPIFMHPIVSQLLQEKPVALDGAWGTEFQKRGLPGGQAPEPWNLDRPETVMEVARAYVEAGSRVILTNTFGANRFILASGGRAEQTAEINRRGAELSKEAAGDKALVFGSIGPSGKMLMTGEVAPDELAEAFMVQAAALKDGGADGIAVETMADLEELKLAVRAGKSAGLPVAGCMVYDSGEKLDRTMMGVSPRQQVEALVEAQADIIGANCGKGIAPLIRVCRQFREAAEMPLWIKPNAGLPKVVEGKTVFTMTPEEFAARIPGVIEAGAAFAGGCCGTGPEFIRALRASPPFAA